MIIHYLRLVGGENSWIRQRAMSNALHPVWTKMGF